MGPKRIVLKSSSTSGSSNESLQLPPSSSTTPRSSLPSKRPLPRSRTTTSTPQSSSSSTETATVSSPSSQRRKANATQESDISLSVSEEDPVDDLMLSDTEASPAIARQKRRGGTRVSSRQRTLLSKISLKMATNPPFNNEEGEEEEEEVGYSQDSELDTDSVSNLDDTASLNSASLLPPSARLTARQRVLLQAEELSVESSPSMEILNLPMARSEMTEEELLRKSEKSRRRKIQRDQKLEQSKASTIQRLLQKHSSRSKKMRTEQKSSLASSVPSTSPISTPPSAPTAFNSHLPSEQLPKPGHTLLVLRGDQVHLHLGEGLDYPRQKLESYPRRANCAAIGCTHPGSSMHAKLLVPVCGSLSCYRKVESQQGIK